MNQKKACLASRTIIEKGLELRKARGTQREYSSKPLKHSIVKRVLVFKQWIWAYFIPYKFFICSDFRSKISARKKAFENFR